jgi:hypothetical protein
MDSTQFSEIFQEELGLSQCVTDDESIGKRFAVAFTVAITNALAIGDRAEQRLAHIGSLRWNGKTVVLQDIEAELRNRQNLVSDYLKQQGVQEELFNWTGFIFRNAPDNSDPLHGMVILSRLGQKFVYRLDGSDEERANIAWEIACRTVHDGIACGAGIELGTLGLFRSDFTFEPHPLLIDTIKAQRKIKTNRASGVAVFRGRRLSIRS